LRRGDLEDRSPDPSFISERVYIFQVFLRPKLFPRVSSIDHLFFV
jgi:hypothetical protein